MLTSSGEESGLLKDNLKDFLKVLFRLYFSISSVTITSIDSFVTLVGVVTVGVLGVRGVRGTFLSLGLFVGSFSLLMTIAFTRCTGRCCLWATFFKLSREPNTNYLLCEEADYQGTLYMNI